MGRKPGQTIGDKGTLGERSVNLQPRLLQDWSAARTGERRHTPVLLSVFIPALFLLPVLFSQSLLPVFLFTLAGFVVFMAALRLLALVLLFSPANPALKTPASTPEQKWPYFTVLVPLYHEAHMVPALMENLAALDYPPEHLKIILVCEADDHPTCNAVRRHLHPPFHLYEVPPSQPRTKPKALNAALFDLPPRERGDIVTVYDAEDRPHPDQLKQAAQALTADADLVAVQAPLGYYNDRTSWISAQFGLEYAALFHVWNPALARLGLPFTLGGTSNHIRYTALEAAGGWDPNNVTEDADLSFRLQALSVKGVRKKNRIGTISAPTYEEAVSTLPAWQTQRSRWLKGFMQTWRVHARKHKSGPDGGPFGQAIYLKNLFALQITVGATLAAAFLHLPSLLILGGAALADSIGLIDMTWPPFTVTIMLMGYGAAILTAIVGVIRANKTYLIKHVPLMPFYWLLYFRPALRAAFELNRNPSLWHKTAHHGEAPGPEPELGCKLESGQASPI